MDLVEQIFRIIKEKLTMEQQKQLVEQIINESLDKNN